MGAKVIKYFKKIRNKPIIKNPAALVERELPDKILYGTVSVPASASERGSFSSFPRWPVPVSGDVPPPG